MIELLDLIAQTTQPTTGRPGPLPMCADSGMLLPLLLIFLGIISSVATDAGYLVLIPLAGLLYAGIGRNPVIGMAAAFAGVSAGFSANLIPGPVDVIIGLNGDAVQGEVHTDVLHRVFANSLGHLGRVGLGVLDPYEQTRLVIKGLLVAEHDGLTTDLDRVVTRTHSKGPNRGRRTFCQLLLGFVGHVRTGVQFRAA